MKTNIQKNCLLGRM